MLETNDHPGELVIRAPSFLQCVKIGAGIAVGAGLTSIFGFAFYFLFVLGLIGGIAGALTPSRPSAPVAAPPAVSRQAPAQASEFEQRVERIQRERADLKKETDAFGEALRREQASRRQPAK